MVKPKRGVTRAIATVICLFNSQIHASVELSRAGEIEEGHVVVTLYLITLDAKSC